MKPNETLLAGVDEKDGICDRSVSDCCAEVVLEEGTDRECRSACCVEGGVGGEALRDEYDDADEEPADRNEEYDVDDRLSGELE